MKLKRLLSIVLVVAMLGICTILPAFAAGSSISAGAVSDGKATFTLTISGASGAEGTLSASGGSITSVSGTGSPVFNSGSGAFACAASGADTVTLSIVCSSSGGPVTLSYTISYANDKNGDDVTVSPSSGSATATPPETTAAPTAAPKTTASTAANLKSLSVKGYTLSPKFSASRTSYTVTVPKDLTSLDVSATALNGDSNVTITGDKNFTAGKSNTIKIAVKAADGTTKTYTIKTVFEEVTTAAAAPTLTGLTINGLQKVNIAFKPEVYQYNVTVPAGTNALDIKAEGVDGADVSVVGADDLSANGNKVVITITGKDGQKTEYTLNVSVASATPVVAKEESKGAPIWLVIVLSLVFLIIGFVIGFIIGKKRGESYYDDDDDNNGGSGFYFGASADDETPAPAAPASSGFNFSGMSFNPAPAPAPVVTPEEAVPLNAPVYTNPVPVAPVAPVAPAAPAIPVAPTPVAAPTPAYVAPPVAPVAAPAPPVAAPVAAPAPAYVAPPASPVAAPVPPVAPVNQEPIYVAPALPYQPGATLTDENIVQPAPKVITKNPFEQCADD